jgi:hypothetical protein
LDVVRELLSGPCAHAGTWPLGLTAWLCDLRPRLLPKGRAGKGYRAIARNGRVLLASHQPLAELTGRRALVRLQTWHRRILAQYPPEPFGILVTVRTLDLVETPPVYHTQLLPHGDGPFDLGLDLGGRTLLGFCRC